MEGEYVRDAHAIGSLFFLLPSRVNTIYDCGRREGRLQGSGIGGGGMEGGEGVDRGLQEEVASRKRG